VAANMAGYADEADDVGRWRGRTDDKAGDVAELMTWQMPRML